MSYRILEAILMNPPTLKGGTGNGDDIGKGGAHTPTLTPHSDLRSEIEHKINQSIK